MKNNKKNPYVLVLGASVVDIVGFSYKKHMTCNSNPGKIKVSYGGVCRNIAENMARVGINTKLISILGDDENGRSMMEHSKLVGYDMSDSLILKNESTPTYMAILDETGEMVSAIVDMKSIDKMNKEFIDSKEDIIKGAEYTFLDSDNPEILEYILTKFKGETKFILDPVSSHKAMGIKHLIKYFHTIKPNRHEAEVLSGISIKSDDDLINVTKYFIGLGVEKVFISLDEEGIFYSDGEIFAKIKANNVNVKNVTGAGDSFVAGLGYGYMKNLPMYQAVKFATAMSIITISHEETIHPDINSRFVKEIMKHTVWTEYTY